eukprot:CCRYP_002024-RA/>CCRYP_002024-RA protein AED:0.01 eAED:0.01 QI:259/1/1/1/1/1/3/1302/1185
MARTRTKKIDGYSSDGGGSATGRYIHPTDRSDTVSEISHDETSTTSKTKHFRPKFFRGKKKTDDTSSVSSSGSKGSLFERMGISSTTQTRMNGGNVASNTPQRRERNQESYQFSSSPHQAINRAPAMPTDSSSVRSAGTASKSSRGHTASSTDAQKLTKDSKARFNIGLVYLKTGDFTKAQQNLEHSLFCYLQLYGHDAKKYSNQVLYQVASVREKLGDCYLANTAIEDKCLAMDHYEEARRLLRGLEKEDGREEVVEMHARIEEKMKDPKLKRAHGGLGCGKRTLPLPPPPPSFSVGARRDRGAGVGSSGPFSVDGKASKVVEPMSPDGRAHKVTGPSSVDGKARKVLGANGLKAGIAGAAVGAWAVAKAGEGESVGSQDSHDYNPFNVLKRVGKNVFEGIDDVIDNIGGVIDNIGVHMRGELAKSISKGIINEEDVDQFEVSIQQLERNNHRTALNHLSALQASGGMKDYHFRALMVDYMMRVAESAMRDEKIGVATDAYEEAFAMLRQEDDPGRTLGLATRGCIKGHKLLAIEDERDEDWESAIQHRNRVHQLLDMENKVVPTCEQLMMVAYCYGQLGNYEQCAGTLSDAMHRLLKGVRSMDVMPKNRIPTLIQCCRMRAVCYSKAQRWQEAHDQYDEVLPLIAREEGIFTKSYNSALVQKGALLVTLGKYREAASALEKYMRVAEAHDTSVCEIVDDNDHLLALDTFAAAHLKLGKVDQAIVCFQKKLEKLKSIPKSDEMKGQTLHNLGCLFAYKKNYKEALPLLSKALDTRKFMYDGTNKYLFESTWGVAATSQALGETNRAMKEYGKLLEKINKVDGSPVDSVTIHNSAGKLYFDENKLDLALKSFNEALKRVEASGSNNTLLKVNILLNLANVKSARGDLDKAVRHYDEIINMKGMKGTREYFLALYNKSLLLVKMGDKEEARLILGEITSRRSKVPDDIKGSGNLSLGQIIMSEKQIDDALQYYDKAVELFSKNTEGLNPMTIQAKKSIAMAYFDVGDYELAIVNLQEVLEDLSKPDLTGKQVTLLRAEIWSCMSRVYNKKDDVASAKNFAKLALQTYKAELGEKHPVTLRQISNLAVILLEEAEALPKEQSKATIDAAKFEMEDALESFVSLNDLWAYRLDVAALKTNLGFIAVWQGKPKKARKLLRQVKEIEIPQDHPLELRIANLECSVQKLEK